MPLINRGLAIPEDNTSTSPSVAPLFQRGTSATIDGDLKTVASPEVQVKKIKKEDKKRYTYTTPEDINTMNKQQDAERAIPVVVSKSSDIVVDKTGIPYQDKKLKDMMHTYDTKYNNITTRFDYFGAAQAGATATQILQHLQKKGSSFDIDGARRKGASDEDIVNYLATKEKPSKKEAKRYRDKILGKARYSGESDFILGFKQAGIGIAKTVMDFDHLIGVVDDKEYKDALGNLNNYFRQMDSEVASHDFFSMHTLGEVVPFLSTMPLAVESTAATMVMESVAGYAMTRGDSSIEASLGWGAVGGVTAGVFGILGTHLSGAAMEKSVTKLGKSLLIDKAESEEFETFFKDFLATHEVQGRKALASARGQALIAYKSTKGEGSEILKNALSYKEFNAQGLLDTLRAYAEDRQRLIGNIAKVHNPEAAIKDVVNSLYDGMQLAKNQYADLTGSYSTLIAHNTQVVDIIKDHITGWASILNSSGMESESAKLAADSFKRITKALEESTGTVGDLIDIEKVINEEARNAKKFSVKSHNITDIKDMIKAAIKDNLNPSQYNNYIKVKMDYKTMGSLRESKLYKMLEDVVSNREYPKSVNIGGGTTREGTVALDRGAGVQLNKNIDDILEGFSKLGMGKNQLAEVQRMLPPDKYETFEKLLVQNAMVENSSRVSTEVLGKALKDNSLLSKSGKEIQEAYNIITRFHSYDSILSKINARGEYIAESTRSGFDATALAALVRTTISLVGRLPVVSKALPKVRQAHLVNTVLSTKQAVIKLNKYSKDLPYSLWQDIITKTEAELSAMDWENTEIERHITPSIPAEPGIYYHSTEYVARGAQLASDLAPVIDRTIVRQRLGEYGSKKVIDAMYSAEQQLLNYNRAVSGIKEARNNSLTKMQMYKELAKDIPHKADKAEVLFNLSKYMREVKAIKPNMAEVEKNIREATAYSNLMTSVAKGVQKVVKKRTIKGQERAMSKNLEAGRYGLAKGNAKTIQEVKKPMSAEAVEEIKTELFNKYMIDKLPKVKESIEKLPSNVQKELLTSFVPKVHASTTPAQLVRHIDTYNKKLGIPLSKLSEIAKGACK